MSLPMLIRLAIPLVFLLASGALFFRVLVLLLVATALMALLAFVLRIMGGGSNRTPGASGGAEGGGKGFVEGSYRIVDDRDEPSS